MNWKEISNKCPKAYQEMVIYNDTIIYNDTRDLYDFFDENEIYIELQIGSDVSESGHNYLVGFDHEIFANNLFGDTTAGGYYKTRTEAETAAFTKAFEILENKLK